MPLLLEGCCFNWVNPLGRQVTGHRRERREYRKTTLQALRGRCPGLETLKMQKGRHGVTITPADAIGEAFCEERERLGLAKALTADVGWLKLLLTTN